MFSARRSVSRDVPLSSLALTPITFKTKASLQKHVNLGPVRVNKCVDLTSHLIINQLKAKKVVFFCLFVFK